MKILKFYPDTKMRLDVFLAEATGFTRSRIKGLCDDGLVSYDGRAVTKCGEIVRGGEVVLNVPDDVPPDAQGEELPLDIIYQDEDIAVVNKAQGVVTHPCFGTKNGTLVNALVFHMKDLSGINGVLRPGIVHRLDKDTSGLLVVAKNDLSHGALSKQIEKKLAGRYYLALVNGNIKEDEGTINQPLGRSERDRKTYRVTSDGRKAVTHYKVLERFVKYTLLEFKLETGRTHQIRVHAKFMRHPVVGDLVYGEGKNPFKLNGQLLHAYKLALTHPKTGEHMEFTAPIPDHFARVLDQLRKDANS